MFKAVKTENDWQRLTFKVGKRTLTPADTKVNVKYPNGETELGVTLYWRKHRGRYTEQGNANPTYVISDVPYIVVHARGLDIRVDLDKQIEIELE